METKSAASLSLASRVLLNDKRSEMPLYGFGLSHNQGGFSRPAVMCALDKGIRLFDTAARYGTEAPLAEAVAASGVPRTDVFVTTKLWPGDVHEGKRACAASGERLGGCAPNLYLVHWPGSWGAEEDDRATAKRRRQEVWRTMELCLESDLCGAIGVSNYEEPHLQDVLEACSVVPAVNQIEFNPYQYPASLKSFCESCGIVIEGYCPLGKGRVLRAPELNRLASKVGKTPAQVLLRWSLEKGVVTIPKTTSSVHLVENLGCFDFALGRAEMEALDGYHCGLRCTWDASGVR